MINKRVLRLRGNKKSMQRIIDSLRPDVYYREKVIKQRLTELMEEIDRIIKQETNGVNYLRKIGKVREE